MKEKTIGIIGKSKTGKTRNVLFNEMNEQIKNNNNLVIYDENLEYYNNFGEELKNNGYTLRVINFKEPIKSNGWDPIEYVNYLYNIGRVDKAIELIQNMGSQLFYTNQVDPYWSNVAASYFTGLVLILIKIAKENKDDSVINFCSLLSLMNDGEKKFGDNTYLMEYLKHIDSMDPIYISLSPIVFAPVETRGSILSVVRQKLNLYFTRPGLVKSFTNNGFKVSELNELEKSAVFIVGYKPHNLLTNILLEQILDVVDSCNKEMTFILDGMDNLPTIDFIGDMIDMANRGKMMFISSIRSKGALSEKYKSLISFNNIEKIITLEDVIDVDVDDKSYELPTLKDEDIKHFDFTKYVK